jgi:hypothetical protein
MMDPLQREAIVASSDSGDRDEIINASIPRMPGKSCPQFSDDLFTCNPVRVSRNIRIRGNMEATTPFPPSIHNMRTQK